MTEAPLQILIVSTSLNSDSKSRRLARAVRTQLAEGGASCDWLDLQENPLPFCGASGASSNSDVQAAQARVQAADAVIIASPVYNYDVNAVAKNFIELTGRAWTDKVVGMVVAAGGQRSGMAPMGLLNSLMLDFRCIVLPRFIYAWRGNFGEDGQPDADTLQRISALADDAVRVAGALR